MAPCDVAGPCLKVADEFNVAVVLTNQTGYDTRHVIRCT